MIKLIITDMDGTLLNSRDQIDPEFWDIERTLSDRGVIFSIASGRPYYNLIKKFDKIKDNLLFICENGSFVMYRGQEIFSAPMDLKDVREIDDECKKIPGIIPLYCGKKSSYADRERFLSGDIKAQNEIKKYYINLKLIDNLSEIDDNIVKIAVCDPAGSEKNSYPVLKKFNGRFQVVLSGAIWLDLSRAGINKGIAIDKIQEKLGIAKAETMAFGDYLNDYEMMKHAGYSYAMKNAHPDLIKISNYVTEHDNNNNGVVKTIKKVFNL